MAGEWKRGHSARGRGGYAAAAGPLPAPDPGGPDDLDDLIDMDPAEYQALVDAHGPPGPPAYRNGPLDEGETAGEAGPLSADPQPAKIPRARASRGGKAAGPKITAAVRNDIEGKFGLMLQLGGSAWAARDPVCGGAFVGQLPAIRPAAVDLILLSPDLVAWFAGVGGGFMLWFNLLAACWPVLATVWAHHGPGAEDDGQGADAAQAYAA